MSHEQIYELADDLQQDILMAIMMAICPFNKEFGWSKLIELQGALNDALLEIDFPPELADDEAITQEALISRIQTHLMIYLRLLPRIDDEERILELLKKVVERVSAIRAQTTHVMRWEAEDSIEQRTN